MAKDHVLGLIDGDAGAKGGGRPTMAPSSSSRSSRRLAVHSGPAGPAT
ncbi:hypothetical protein [Paracoccus marcusii]